MYDQIRSFFSTPPRRPNSSLGAGQSDQDEPAIPAFQQAWKDGATFDDMFGPEPLTLHGTVGRSGADNHRPDVAKVETFLGDAGYYKPLTKDGPSGWHSTNLDSAIRSFQKDNGLEVDGFLKPRGPTISKIGSLLGGTATAGPQPTHDQANRWGGADGKYDDHPSVGSLTDGGGSATPPKMPVGLPSALGTPRPKDPFDDHTISEDGAREHDSYAATLVRDSNPDETARTLKNIIGWYGDQGRGDVADLLGRFAKVDEAKAKALQDALHGASGERIPFRIAPLGAGMAAEAAGEEEVKLPTRNPFGSSEGADRWEAGNMAKALLGKSDYADAVTHFTGEFKRDPGAARAYTAAVYQDMAAASPKQAVEFAQAMGKAGLAEEAKKPEGSGGVVMSAPIPPTVTPGPIPPAQPGETDIRIPAPQPPEQKPEGTSFPVPIPPTPNPQPGPQGQGQGQSPGSTTTTSSGPGNSSEPPRPTGAGQNTNTDPSGTDAVKRDTEVLKDPSNVPGYTQWLANGATKDPQWAEQHAKEVSRELYKQNPQAAEEMVKEGEKAGVKVGLYADGHQSPKTPADLLKEAGGKHLSSGPDAGSKECVALVKHAVPELQGIRADQWKEGEKIKGMGDPPLKPGTALATFKDGKYENKPSGNHAVVFEGYGEDKGKKGMWVVDQWSQQKPKRTFIPFEAPNGKPIYQAENYSVIRRP